MPKKLYFYAYLFMPFLLILFSPQSFYSNDLPKYGIVFEDLADSFNVNGYPIYPYSSTDMRNAVSRATDNFLLLRTMSDFNEGDASDWGGSYDNHGLMASCGPTSTGVILNARACAFNNAVRALPDNADIMLGIDNPTKWLITTDSATRYLYQYVLPIVSHVKVIVVGWEVGLHLSTTASDFSSKKQ
ncbi:hypothetical protein [Piscirickettsia litoralis]|uniref:Uncharacterized protein n=1 Tax=Piscirickettsia litoralis TaxID=1891921 RepID=A0ABX3A4V1_9GAMM|nr:hypothetical protein [Piscirickettsia litoralis]ODN43894.1 hypothetical protein BGC07_14620 [Piscirickettsia litoralis]